MSHRVDALLAAYLLTYLLALYRRISSEAMGLDFKCCYGARS